MNSTTGDEPTRRRGAFLFHPRPNPSIQENAPGRKRGSPAHPCSSRWRRPSPSARAFTWAAAAMPTSSFSTATAKSRPTTTTSAPFYNRIGINFLAADYRGYGRSTGHPTVTSMMRGRPCDLSVRCGLAGAQRLQRPSDSHGPVAGQRLRHRTGGRPCGPGLRPDRRERVRLCRAAAAASGGRSSGRRFSRGDRVPSSAENRALPGAASDHPCRVRPHHPLFRRPGAFRRQHLSPPKPCSKSPEPTTTTSWRMDSGITSRPSNAWPPPAQAPGFADKRRPRRQFIPQVQTALWR